MTLCFLVGVGSQLLLAEEVKSASTVSDPKAVVVDVFAKSKKTSITTNVSEQKAVSHHFNFEKMASSILSEKGKQISETEKKWFVQTIEEIISQTVYPKAPDFFSGVKISYEEVVFESDKKMASLNSVISKKGEETEVKYRFQRANTDWKIIDISVDDESWVEVIRDEVDSIWKKEKWAGVKKRLVQRLDKIKKKS